MVLSNAILLSKVKLETMHISQTDRGNQLEMVLCKIWDQPECNEVEFTVVYIKDLTSVPQISSVSAYITQFKMPNTHRISFPGVSNTHVKFYFTQTFYIMRVIISPRETKHNWFSFSPLDCVEFYCCFFSSHCAAWYNVYCIRMQASRIFDMSN